MIDHVSLGVADLDRAVVFYDAVLAPLGYRQLWTNARSAGYGVQGTEEPLAIVAAGAHARPAGAGCHLALTAHSRVAVDGFHAAGLALGATDEGPPGLRPHYGAGYYAAFLLDPDGHKLEAVYHGA